MAVSIDTGNFFLEENGSTSATTFTTTGSVTCSASDNLLAIFLSSFANNAITFNSVTWNSQSLTRKGGITNSNLWVQGDLWTLVNPSAATSTITVNVSVTGGLGGFNFVAAIPIGGVNTVSPLGTLVTFASQTNPVFPFNLTASGAGASDAYIAWAAGNVTTAAASGSNQVNLGATGGGEASYILGNNAGAFRWTGSGGGNTNAIAMAVPVFGFVPPPLGGGVFVTA